jgi:RNA polymerase sigma-70 factor (ECF subfamily)
MSFLGKNVNKILLKIKMGDEESKNVLFNKTYNHLKGVAYSYVYDKNDVEDVLVEAYDKVFRRLDSFDFKKDGYNWMCKIIQHTAYDFNKKSVKETPFEEVEKRAYPVDIEEKIALEDEVERLLQGYSERDKTILKMYFWKNQTIMEIAEELGMGKSNVHKRMKLVIEQILEKEKQKVEK